MHIMQKKKHINHLCSLVNCGSLSPNIRDKKAIVIRVVCVYGFLRINKQN